MQLIKGDITLETEGLIIHGVNCSGKMASGVALAIRNKWPVVYTRFVEAGSGQKLLGLLDTIWINDKLCIGNGYTQLTYGYDGQRYADLEAVRSVVHKAFLWCEMYQLALKAPKIASDRGGLSWDDEVKPLFLGNERKFGFESKIYHI